MERKIRGQETGIRSNRGKGRQRTRDGETCLLEFRQLDNISFVFPVLIQPCLVTCSVAVSSSPPWPIYQNSRVLLRRLCAILAPTLQLAKGQCRGFAVSFHSPAQIDNFHYSLPLTFNWPAPPLKHHDNYSSNHPPKSFVLLAVTSTRFKSSTKIICFNSSHEDIVQPNNNFLDFTKIN